jgi:hypothetical protein
MKQEDVVFTLNLFIGAIIIVSLEVTAILAWNIIPIFGLAIGLKTAGICVIGLGSIIMVLIFKLKKIKSMMNKK